AGDGDQRPAELPRHVLDEARLAAAGRPLEHDGETAGVALLEDHDLVAGGQVPGFRRGSPDVVTRSAFAHGVEAAGAGLGSAAAVPVSGSKRGARRKKSYTNSPTPTANTDAVSTSMRKCTWILSCVSR